MTAILGILALLFILFLLRTLERYSQFNNFTTKEPPSIRIEEVLSAEELYYEKTSTEELWYKLSWSGKNPAGVIKVGLVLAQEKRMNVFEMEKFFASCFYSQVKFLVKKFQIPTAIAFFLLSKKSARIALNLREVLPRENKSPVDLEVLGAPDFMLASVPLVGVLFKKRAALFLEQSLTEINVGGGFNPLLHALILAKLWKLTKKDKYKEDIKSLPLTGAMEDNQLTRVAKHLGLPGSKELLEFCNS